MLARLLGTGAVKRPVAGGRGSDPMRWLVTRATATLACVGCPALTDRAGGSVRLPA